MLSLYVCIIILMFLIIVVTAMLFQDFKELYAQRVFFERMVSELDTLREDMNDVKSKLKRY